MPHRKPVGVLNVGITDLKILDAGSRRAAPQELYQLTDTIFRALQMALNGAVRTVPDPSVNIEAVGLFARPGTEKDALNAAADPDVPRNFGHQTTLMSGASSAFMPTTL
jgi:hypothetical protein